MMNRLTDKEIILENDCVLLRPLAESDFENLLPFALNEADLSLIHISEPTRPY